VNAVVQSEEKLSCNDSVFVAQDAWNAFGKTETDRSESNEDNDIDRHGNNWMKLVITI
jgi:hypothetical protein